MNSFSYGGLTCPALFGSKRGLFNGTDKHPGRVPMDTDVLPDRVSSEPSSSGSKSGEKDCRKPVQILDPVSEVCVHLVELDVPWMRPRQWNNLLRHTLPVLLLQVPNPHNAHVDERGHRAQPFKGTCTTETVTRSGLNKIVAPQELI
ncbi:hypothetical protein F2P79_020891 [Pimephales promelas]|nr:hypothetical protein F2P79_020891 [Pimephales promelas]